MRPRESLLYGLVGDHQETFEQAYDGRFARTYGFWRPEIERTLLAFRDCGIAELGFARLRCPECHHELAALRKGLRHRVAERPEAALAEPSTPDQIDRRGVPG